jgi:two-component system alkaline phosphatase synthesis response regulator PhoP
MNKKQTVLILQHDRRLLPKLEQEIKAIGYIPEHSPFPDLRTADIFHQAPDAVILVLTEWNSNIKNNCEAFMKKATLSACFPVIALLSPDIISKVPAEWGFSGMAVSPYTRQELDLRIARAISQFKQKANRGIIVIDEITIDTSSCEVRIGQTPLSLTFKEYELLKHLQSIAGIYIPENPAQHRLGASYYGGTAPRTCIYPHPRQNRRYRQKLYKDRTWIRLFFPEQTSCAH